MLTTIGQIRPVKKRHFPIFLGKKIPTVFLRCLSCTDAAGITASSIAERSTIIDFVCFSSCCICEIISDILNSEYWCSRAKAIMCSKRLNAPVAVFSHRHGGKRRKEGSIRDSSWFFKFRSDSVCFVRLLGSTVCRSWRIISPGPSQ